MNYPEVLDFIESLQPGEEVTITLNTPKGTIVQEWRIEDVHLEAEAYYLRYRNLDDIDTLELARIPIVDEQFGVHHICYVGASDSAGKSSDISSIEVVLSIASTSSTEEPELCVNCECDLTDDTRYDDGICIKCFWRESEESGIPALCYGT